YVFAESMLRIFPFSIGGQETKLLAVGTILLLTSINYLGVILGGFIENVFTLLKITGILLVVGLAFVYGHGSQLTPVALSSELHPVTGFGLLPIFFSAMLGAFWAYDG